MAKTNRKRPPNSGRKKLPEGEKKLPVTFKLSPDVISIIKQQPKQAPYIEAAIREKFTRENP